MNNAIILQQAHSNSEYANMLRLSYARHCGYALNYKMDLDVIVADIPRDARRHPLGKMHPERDYPLGAWAKLFFDARRADGKL